MERAFALAQRAIALDDSLALAHRLVGLVYLWHRQHEQALAEAERTLALDPNDPENYDLLAFVLNFVGRPAEAIGLMEKAMRLNPRHDLPTYLTTLEATRKEQP